MSGACGNVGSVVNRLQDFWHIEVVEPFLAHFNAAPKLTYRQKKAIQAEIDGYYKDMAKIAKYNAAKGFITGDLEAQHIIGISFSDEMVQREAVKYAEEYGRLLEKEGASIINGKKVPWLREANKDTRSGVADILKRGLEEGKPVTDISGRYADPGTIAYDLKEYLGAQDSRLARIARTEMARFESTGTLMRYKDAGITRVKWLTASDPCEQCAPYSNQIFDMADVPELPVHPNCRCAYAPVVSSIKE